MDDTMAEKKTSIVLSGQNDWDEWIELIKTTVIAADVRDFINPDILTASLLLLEEPAAP